MGWLFRFWDSSVGKKVVMALTGIIGLLFVLGHMLGNLQVFLGPTAINDYAVGLRKIPALLWIARSGLILGIVFHVVAAVQLQGMKRRARPVRYQKPGNIQAGPGSRTMIFSGLLIFVFIGYHLAHMTWGFAHPSFVHLKVYENLISGFSTIVSIGYIVAVLLLGMHISHGAWSLFFSLGLIHPKYNDALRGLSFALMVVVVFGFISVPAGLIVGVIR